MVRIITDPEGVEVWSAGALLGNTPFSVPRPEDEENLTLLLRQPGYREHEVRLSRLTQEEVRVTLVRERTSSSTRGGSRSQKTPRPSEPTTTDDGPRPVGPTRPAGSEVLDPWASGR